MEITVPELTKTNILYGWLAIHLLYGVVTHYLGLAKLRAFAKQTGDSICPKAFTILFLLRMGIGLECRVIETVSYYTVKILVGLATFSNIKPWNRSMFIDRRFCVVKTCQCHNN